MDFLIDTFRKLESGEIKVDYSPMSMRSNVTTNNAVNRITEYASRLGFKVPQWGAVYCLAANANSIESSKVNVEITKLQIENKELKAKFEKERNEKFKLRIELGKYRMKETDVRKNTGGILTK